MIANEEKIDLIINKLNNIEAMIVSFIDNAEACQDKYSLEEELEICNAKKAVLLEALQNLGGTWPKP